MNHIPQVVDFGSLHGLRLHEVVWYHLNVQLVKLLSVFGQVLHGEQIFCDDATLHVGLILAELDAPVGGEFY